MPQSKRTSLKIEAEPNKGYNPNALYFSEKLRAKTTSILQFPFTIVVAPMGYGKTTAIREALKNMECTVLWQAVFEAGSSYFWSDFCDAFSPLSPELAENLRQIGLPTDLIRIRQAVELIRKTRMAGDTALVIDDYHFVNSSDVDSFFTYLLANIPHRLHVVILSRTAFLASDIAEMQLKGSVNYINMDTLKLDLPDIREYCALCGMSVSSEELTRLYEYSEGWITPLYLSMLEYAATGGVTAKGEVDALICHTVYNPLPDEIQSFLSHVCIFDSFTLKQASFMWRLRNAEALLMELMRRNAFITKDASTGRYAFHNLLSRHVREVFDALPESERVDIWKRAGEYFIAEGITILALEFFNKAGDFTMMLKALVSRNGVDLTNEHREKVLDCFDNCPDELLGQNLSAVIVFILIMTSYNEKLRLARCIAVFEKNISDFSGTQAEKNELMLYFERFLGLSKFNNIKEMSSHHRKAITYMDKLCFW